MKAKLIKTYTNNFILQTNEGIISGTLEPTKFEYKLSLKNCQAIERGYDLDDIKRKVFDGFDGQPNSFTIAAIERTIQIMVELMGDKKFSEDDVKKAIESTISNCSVKRVRNRYIPDELLDEVECNLSEEDIIQSLQQTEWDVEVKEHYIGECNGNDNNGCFFRFSRA